MSEKGNMSSTTPTLSPVNPVLSYRLQDAIASGSAALIGTGGLAPAIINNNSTDTALGRTDGNRCWMMADSAYGFGVQDSASDQGFTFTFQSTVAGYACISIRLATINSAGYTTLSFQNVGGPYTGATGNLRNYVTTLNSTSASYIFPGLANGLPVDTNQELGYFGWVSPSTSNSGLTNVVFPIVQGTNTITFTKGTDYRCAGAIAEGICVWLASGNNWQHSLPNYNRLPISYNLAPIQAKLKQASSRVLRVLFLGDSLLRYNNNWGDPMEATLSAQYGAAGRYLTLGSNGGGNYPDISSNWGTRSGVNAPTVTVTGGSDYSGSVYDTMGTQWSQSTTGTLLTASNSSGATTWELIYMNVANGGSFNVSVNNSGTGGGVFSTNGTAGSYGIIIGSWSASSSSNTITVTKTDTTSAGGVAILSVSVGASKGLRSMRLAIPGWAFGYNGNAGILSGSAGTLAQWYQFLNVMNFDLIIIASANNSNANFLASDAQPFQNFLTVLTNSSAAGTSLLLCDLHIFANISPYTATASVAGQSGAAPIAFPPFSSYGGSEGLGSQAFNNSIYDLAVYNRWGGTSMSFASFSAYIGLRDQVAMLFPLNFYNGTTGYSSDSNAGAITDWHFCQPGANSNFAAANLVGSTLANIVMGNAVPNSQEIAADPIAVAAVAAAPSGSAPVSMGIGL